MSACPSPPRRRAARKRRTQRRRTAPWESRRFGGPARVARSSPFAAQPLARGWSGSGSFWDTEALWNGKDGRCQDLERQRRQMSELFRKAKTSDVRIQNSEFRKTYGQPIEADRGRF